MGHSRFRQLIFGGNVDLWVTRSFFLHIPKMSEFSMHFFFFDGAIFLHSASSIFISDSVKTLAIRIS